jgi:hypothetical protein
MIQDVKLLSRGYLWLQLGVGFVVLKSNGRFSPHSVFRRRSEGR